MNLICAIPRLPTAIRLVVLLDAIFIDTIVLLVAVQSEAVMVTVSRAVHVSFFAANYRRKIYVGVNIHWLEHLFTVHGAA